MSKIYGYDVSEWILAFLDVLDGSADPKEIHYNTGMSMERCAEISKMYYAAAGNGFPNKADIEELLSTSK